MKNFNTNTANNDVWLTPPEIIQSLGDFNLDPCSPIDRPWDTAIHHYNKIDDGLLLPWFDRVWLNPPYGKELGKWLEKMAMHQNGTALIFSRTETEAFQRYVFGAAESILFIKGRLKFYGVDGEQYKWNANAPSVLIGYDEFNAEMIEQSGIKGHHVYLNGGVFIIGLSKNNKTWQIIVGEALEEINDAAKVSEIYDKVITLAPDRVKQNRNYKAKVRQILQRHYTKVKHGTYKFN